MTIKNKLKLLSIITTAIFSFFIVGPKNVFAVGNLTVTNITANKSYAEANDNYQDGWSWTFDVTVPTNETILNMKFTDWVSGSNSISIANNSRFYSPQSTNAFDQDSAIIIDSTNTYSSVINLNPASDLDTLTDGLQIKITVEFKIPLGSVDGSYSNSYGIKTIDPDSLLVATDKTSLTEDSIKGANPDLLNITVGLTNPLPSIALNGSIITWTSSNTSVISNDGQTINRPLSTSEDASVILTATLTKGVITDTKTFNLIVTRNTGIQATPTFNPTAGEIVMGTTVTISSANADAIYYTTDGSDPTTSSTNQASTPLVINSAPVTVKALAIRAGYDNSAIGSATYTQGATADLTNLVISGSPNNYTFNSSTYDYTGVTVLNGVESVTVTPTGSGTITVEGTEVASGNASASIALTAGVEKTITIVATETGKPSKTYTIKITRIVAIGQEYQGGIVFYIDATGLHGLIAAPMSFDTTSAWGCSGTDIVGAGETGIGSGYQNTVDMNTAGCPAATAIYAVTKNGYSDWYLPSLNELLELKTKITCTNSEHWSSSEYATGDAWIVNWNGSNFYSGSKGGARVIRAIRSF